MAAVPLVSNHDVTRNCRGTGNCGSIVVGFSIEIEPADEIASASSLMKNEAR